MSKLFGCLGILAVALSFAAPAGANTVTTQVFTDNFTVLAPRLTRGCGFPIYRTNVGSYKVALFYDNNGVLFKEIDTNFGGPYTITVTNPANGKSATTQSSSAVTTVIYNSDGSVASVSFSGIEFNFVAPGFGTILQVMGRWGLDPATGGLTFVGGQFDLANGNFGAFCAYMADP